jgi:Holliday junction resolvasome RuvABC endonuclease subunit
MILLGFDPGMDCGIAVIKREGPRPELLFTQRVLTIPKHGDDSVRYARICRELALVVDLYRPRLVVIEDQKGVQVGAMGRGEFNGNNTKASVVVGCAIGIATDWDVPVQFVGAMRAKIALLGPGHGHADKKAVQRGVRIIFGLKADLSEPESDAVAIALSGRMLIRLTPNE